MTYYSRFAALAFVAAACSLLSITDAVAAGFQISASGSGTNLHLRVTTPVASRLLWMSGDRVDAITNIANIEFLPLGQHDFQPPAPGPSRFFRAALIDTNVPRTPYAGTAAHSLAILTNGSIVCWGDNSLGQFGNSAPKELGGAIINSNACWIVEDYINKSTGPLPQSGDTDWISVAAGADYCLALKANGTLWAWGNNVGGFGYDVPGGFYKSFYAFPVPVGTNMPWQSVFAYGESSFAIRTNGTLWAWGNNTGSVLGLGNSYTNTNLVILPTQVGTASNWVNVASFGNVSMGIQSDGSLWAWGSTTLPSYVRAGYAETNLATPLTSSPALVNIPGPWVGASFSTVDYARGILLRSDGTIWAATTHANDYSAWLQYDGFYQDQFTNPASIYNFLITAGATQDEALSYINGEFYTLYPALRGYNFDYPTFLQQTSDAQFLQPYATRSNWVILDSGIALNQDGTIWTLGEGSTRSAASPKDGDWQRVNADTDWRWVSADFVAAKADGTLWGWEGGTFPDPSLNTNWVGDMLKVPGTNKWISAKLTLSHIVAMDTKSNLWAWGSNEQGQLGVGDNEPRLTPTPLPMAGPWANFTVAGPSSDSATFAVRTNGELWAWGDYNFTGTNVPSPIQLNPERVWRTVCTYNAPYNPPAVFQVGMDGTLWAYGNNFGQALGITNTDATITVPTQVAGSNWLSVAPAAGFAIALKTDGTRWGWGNSSINMGLGFSTNLTYTNPVIVPGNTWTDIAADASDGFAIRSDGTLWSWGQFDPYCELGQASVLGLMNTQCWSCIAPPCSEPINPEVQPYGTNIVAVPLQVGTASDWKMITYAEYGTYTLGLKQDGTLWVWGLSPFPSVTNQTVFLTPPTHVFPGIPYPQITVTIPFPEQVGTNHWRYVDASGAAVTTSGDLYLWNNRAANGQTFSVPPWLPAPIRSNVVCRLPRLPI